MSNKYYILARRVYTQEDWLTVNGDRTFEDVARDEYGLYVFMGCPTAKNGYRKVYLPSYLK